LSKRLIQVFFNFFLQKLVFDTLSGNITNGTRKAAHFVNEHESSIKGERNDFNLGASASSSGEPAQFHREFHPVEKRKHSLCLPAFQRSGDDGKNRHSHRILENEPERGYCYTAMFFTKNALLLSYNCGGGGNVCCLQDARISRIEL